MSKPNFGRAFSMSGIDKPWGLGPRDTGMRFAPEGVPSGDPAPVAVVVPDNSANLASLQQWADSQAAGLKQTNQALKDEKKEVQRKLEELTTHVGDLDIDKVREMLSAISSDDEMQLIQKDGFKGLQQVVDTRTENLRKDLETRLTAAQTALDEKDGALTAKNETISRLTIDSQVRELGLAMDPPMDARALPDAIRAAREVFALGDDDDPVAKQPDGSPIIGKDGRTPLGMTEWLSTTFEGGKTVWWGSSSGGGATGGGELVGKGLTKDDLESMSPRQKLAAGYE